MDYEWKGPLPAEGPDPKCLLSGNASEFSDDLAGHQGQIVFGPCPIGILAQRIVNKVAQQTGRALRFPEAGI
jgi:hypothetical protein